MAKTFRRTPERLPHRMPDGLGTVEPIEQPATEAQSFLADPADLVHRALDGMRRNVRHTDQPFGIVLTELGDEVVVGAVGRGDDFRILYAVFNEANTIDNFRFDAVDVQVLEAELRIGWMRRFPSDIHHSFAAMAGEPASSHPAAIRAHGGAISHPRWDAVYIDHLRDLILQTSDGARGKRVGRKKKEIEMTIGRYDFSVHINSRAAA
ncbi:MAG: hypothetical protein ACTHMB_05370 [Candidatus Binatia bacterium]